MNGKTFKVIFVKTNDLSPADKIEYDERRIIEREIGLRIEGEADVNHPELVYGIVTLGGRWYFGAYHKNKATWFRQMKNRAAIPLRSAQEWPVRLSIWRSQLRQVSKSLIPAAASGQ